MAGTTYEALAEAMVAGKWVFDDTNIILVFKETSF